jgi:cytochrome b6-f complex iron-sulfur subunit
MVDRSKMSVAEMLAAARKADGGDSTPDAEASTPAEPAVEEAASEEAVSETPAETPASSNPTAAKSASGGRLSVAEMMAMARGENAGGGEKPAAKPAAKKPAAKAKPAAAKKAEPAKPAEPRDTASILAAAKKAPKAGPMNKAEAAAKEKANPKPKAKIIVPPMPEKPAYAMAKPAAKPKKGKAAEETRRGFLGVGMWGLGVVGLLWSAATLKFMFPNVLREPPSKFKVGGPDAYPAGQVNTKFKAQFGVWIANADYNGQQQIYALRSVCTHLGCTPNWLEAEQKFKCPCHGSGFYKDGINFEGPAPRPLERFAIRIADDGQIEIDKSRLFFEEKGEWSDASCFIPV